MLAIAGCKVDQQAEVENYRKILDQDTPAVDFVPGQQLSLERALALANQHNELLGLRGEDYLQAMIAKDRAASTFMPTVVLVPSYYSQQSSHPERDSTDRRFDGAVAAQANLFNGFSDLRVTERPLPTSTSAPGNPPGRPGDRVSLDVARTYYQILRSEQTVVVLRNSLVLRRSASATCRAGPAPAWPDRWISRRRRHRHRRPAARRCWRPRMT